jgi:hypothetical protein
MSLESPGGETFPILESVWVSGEDFLKHFTEGEVTGRFFHPVEDKKDLPAEAVPDAMISVNLRFLYRNAEFHLHAKVLERREEGDKRGLELELLPEERDRQELVKACAEGQDIPYYERRFPRVACDLPVKLEVESGQVFQAHTTNISEGGVGLRPDHNLMIDMLVSVIIDLPQKYELRARGQIVFVITQGPQRGLGVKFLFESDEERDDVEEMVAWIRENT